MKLEGVKAATDRVEDVGRESVKRSRRGAVYFITSDKNIQAIKTAAAFGIVSALLQSIAETANLLLRLTAEFRLPPAWIVLVGMIAVFWVADYADANTERWRDLVETATGEAAADDTADE